MTPFDLRAFMATQGMRVPEAQRVFAVSRRTIYYWRARGMMPGPALRLAQSIARQSAPWNSGFKRGHYIGTCGMAWQWRDELFAQPGGKWQDYRRPLLTQERHDRRRRLAQLTADKQAREDAKRKARRAASRRAAQTRLEQRAA